MVVESIRSAVPGALVCALLTVVASLDGGYFPSTWGWLALGLLLTVATALVALRTIVLGRLDWILLLSFGGFLLWTALSTLWSASVPRTVLELQRDLVYLAAVAAIVLTWRRALLTNLLGGILLSTVAVSSYALGTRLLPDRLGHGTGDVARLAAPLGYWNALGLFAVIGVLLALGFAASGRPRSIRCAAAAAPLVLVLTLYFTLGRAAWITLAVGVGVAIAVDRRRTRMALTALALAPAVAAGVWLASQAEALASDAAAAPNAADEGHRLAAALLVLAIASAFAPVLVDRVESRIRLPSGSRRAFVGLVLAALVLALALVVRTGGPETFLGNAYDAFRAPMPQSGGLERRLISFSGSGRADYWQIAWSDYWSHPWLGSGAGTYELSWNRERPNAFGARDAHSLYLETLAELGPLGLALLLAALGTPLLALGRGRQESLTAAAAAAYIAFLFHAAVDWDWEMPAVALAGLLCGGAVVAGSRGGEELRCLTSRERAVALVAAVVLGAFAFVGAVGNGAVSASTDALAQRRFAQAEIDARKATKWAPWSSEAWRLLGEAQLAQGNVAAARASFRAAIRRDPNDWLPWSDLLSVTRGPERLHALREVSRLNPRSIVAPSRP